MVDNIERQLSKKLHIVLTAHMDPIKVDDPIVALMNEVTTKVTDSLDGISNVHDLRVVPGPTHTNIIFDIVVNPSCKLSNKEIHQAFTDAIKAIDENYFVVINFDKNYVNQV